MAANSGAGQVICSRNELVAALHKVLSAVGAPTAVGEEVAVAGGWLGARQYDAIGSVLAAIESPWPSEINSVSENHETVFPTARIALAGPVALDMLEAGLCRQASLLAGDSPRLLAGLAATRLEPDSAQYFTASVAGGDWRPLHDQAGSLAVSDDVSIRLVKGAVAIADEAAPIEVNARDWAHLMRMAAAMYVPSSEQSRAAGAGAGLLDND